MYSKLLFLIASLIYSSILSCQISLPKIFDNNMVLQRDIEIPVWGTAKPGTRVIVELDGIKNITTVGKDGKWMLRLPKKEAGGPYKMIISEESGPDSEIIFENILIGDVWLASGQSNMEWKVEDAMNAEEETQQANYPDIRFFVVEHNIKLTPQTNVKNGSWKLVTPENVKTNSAVAYYFSRELHTNINVPIGIIQSTWGGTPVEAWTSREALLSCDITKQRMLNHDTITENHFEKDSVDLIEFWDIVYNPKNNADHIIPKEEYDDTGWEKVNMPVTLKDWGMPFYVGIVWLRKEINIPASMAGKVFTINLGHPEMNYSLYFNGEEICKTIWNANLTHEYKIPASATKEGVNVIAVRMSFLWGGGGFNPPTEDMYLTDGANKISLSGDWKYKKDMEPAIPKINNYHRFPSFLYNGMINPIIPYGVKGFIWYQGEDNVDSAAYYSTLFSLMITDWRNRWQQGDLPFLYVQLANYMKCYQNPTESDWALLRESQTKTLALPNTGMACIIDIGEANSIHPINKQEVGRRLALQAQKVAYGKSLNACGPYYVAHKIVDSKVIIEFRVTGGGLTVDGGGKLKGFAISGKDGVFHWADAQIKNDYVIVSSNKVSSPVAVRYAWADNPECNLIDKEGLPAVPFRTDDW